MSSSGVTDHEQEALLLRIKVEELERELAFQREIPCTTCHKYKTQCQDLLRRFDEIKGYFPKIVQFMHKHIDAPQREEAPPPQEPAPQPVEQLETVLQHQIDCNEQYQGLQAQIIDLQQQLAAATTQLHEKEDALIAAQAKATVLQETVDALREEKTSLGLELSEARKGAADAQNEAQQLRALLEHQKVLAQQQTADLAARLQHLVRENVTLEHRAKKLAAEVEFLRK